MLKLNTGFGYGKLLLAVSLVAGFASAASAGNVYSWVTEDGTHAFTDDAKRVPAKHKQEAKRRPLGELTRYSRYTEVSAEKGKPYVERIHERQAAYREVGTVAPQGAVVGAMASEGQGPGIGYTVPVSGGGNGGRGAASNLWVPVKGSDNAGPDVTTIESKRMKPENSMATRHWTIIKEGDRVTTVIKGELRQRPLKAVSESDYDL